MLCNICLLSCMHVKLCKRDDVREIDASLLGIMLQWPSDAAWISQQWTKKIAAGMHALLPLGRLSTCRSLLGRKRQITMHATTGGNARDVAKWAATAGQLLGSFWKSVCWWTAGTRKSLCELDTWYDQLFNASLYADSSGQQVLVGACWLYRAHYYLQTIKAAVALLWFDTRMHAYGPLARPI